MWDGLCSVARGQIGLLEEAERARSMASLREGETTRELSEAVAALKQEKERLQEAGQEALNLTTEKERQEALF